MKLKIKIINTILLFSIVTIFSSRNGQNASDKLKDKPNIPDSTAQIGEVVTEMEATLTTIFQDSQNNYWFGGGDKGVYKYDLSADRTKAGGNSLVLFTTKEGLCSNAILGIQEDKYGNIYFDTPEGVSKFDGQQFTTLEVTDSNSSKNEWKLERDDLWFRMGWDKNGPYRYDGKLLYQLEFPKTNQADEFYSKYPNASYNPYGIYTMYKDRKGSVWFGTASLGVCRYDGKSISWLYERQLTETPSGGDFGIRSIIEDKDGYFWFCNTRYRYEILLNSTENNGTSQINYRKENGTDKSTNNNEKDFTYFMSIAEDDSGDLWMVTYNDGVWQKKGKNLIHFPIKDGETDVLLFSIYKDNQGILWLGTHNAGVFKFNGKTFEKFKL